MPFEKTAKLLTPLAKTIDPARPTVWLAPGMSGIGILELLIARVYGRYGQIKLLSSPSLLETANAIDIVEEHIDSIIAQLPEEVDLPELHLAGYSLGAHVILEVACRLVDQGRKISSVTLINSYGLPDPKLLTRIDISLWECRSLRDIQIFAMGRLQTRNRTLLLGWIRVLEFLARSGADLHADEFVRALFSRIAAKSWFSFKPSRYPGTITFIRPIENISDMKEDWGWSALAEHVHVSKICPSDGNFVGAGARQLIVDQLIEIVRSRGQEPIEMESSNTQHHGPNQGENI